MPATSFADRIRARRRGAQPPPAPPDNAPNPLYPEDDPVERAKAFLRAPSVVDTFGKDPSTGRDLFRQHSNEARAIARATPAGQALSLVDEPVAAAQDFFNPRIEALRRSSQGYANRTTGRGGAEDEALRSAAEWEGFAEGAMEGAKGLFTPWGIASTAIPGARLGRTGQTLVNAGELAQGLYQGTQAAEQLAAGDQTGAAISGGQAAVGALGALLGQRTMSGPAAANRPAAVRPPSISVDGAPFEMVGSARAGQPKSRVRAALDESVLDAELIHEAGPSSLPGPAGLLPPPGARPGDGGPLVTPPPPAAPEAFQAPRVGEASRMPPGPPVPGRSRVRAALDGLPPLDPAARAGQDRMNAGITPDFIDQVAPEQPSQQTIRLPQPIDVMGRQAHQITVDGDVATLHLTNGETMDVPSFVLEQGFGIKPEPPNQLRSQLTARQRQPEVSPDISRDQVGSPDAAVEPGPLSPDADYQLAELMSMLRGGDNPPDLAGFERLPAPFGGRGADVPASLADFEHLPPPAPEMGDLAEAFRVPRGEAPPFGLTPPKSGPDASQPRLPVDPLDELSRMFDEPELPGAREWQPPAAAGDAIDLGDVTGMDTRPEAMNANLGDADVINPRGPGYRQQVLRQAKTGAPGLGAEQGPTGTTLVYRGPDGTPVGVATLAADGKTIVDFAVSQDHGLLGGRAAKVLGDELAARGANAVEGGMTPDAKKFMDRMQQRRQGKAPIEPTTAAVPPPVEAAQPQARAAGAENVDQSVMDWITEQIEGAGASMPTKELTQAAFTDPLTGLPNRGGQGRIEQRMQGKPLYGALDLRNLKAVNEHLGMAKGDELVKLVSEEIKNALRKGDVPARWGGDEFMLALQNVSEEGRPVVQQKIMDAVDRALGRFGTRQAGQFPLGARMAFGETQDIALNEMGRQKGMEKGPKFRPMDGQPGELPQAPANPTPMVRYEMPANAIEVDAKRFQYRKNVSKSGVDAERRLEGDYDPSRGGVIGVWKDPQDGKTYVVNGHHRLELAQKAGADVAVVYLHAPDAASARAAGAMINLSEGNSSMADAVNFLRDSGMTVEDLRKYGIRSNSTIGRDAPAIASLSDAVRQKWENGDLDDGLAATIGHAKLAPEQQTAVAQLVERQKNAGRSITANVLKNVIEQVRRADTVNMAGQGAQSNIFDVLGEDQFASSAIARAELTDHIRQQLAKDKRLFGFVSKGDRAGKLEGAGVGTLDADKAGAIAANAKVIEATFDRLEANRGPIADALNDAARRIMQGENANVVRQEALAAIRLGVETELRGEIAAGPSRSGEAAPVPVGSREPGSVREGGAGAAPPAGRDLVEPQPRLPGEVGAVRDVEQPPALFEAPYALRGEAAPDPIAETQKLLGVDDVELPPARPRDPDTKIFDQPDDLPGTYGQLKPNERDFLTKRLKYSKDDINAMSVEEARRIGRDQTFNPKLTERNADATARYDRTLDELSSVFETEQPGKVAKVVQRTRDLRAGQRRPAEAPSGAALERARERQGPMRAEAEREMAAARAAAGDEKRAATPKEMKAKQDAQAHRARDIGKAIDSGDYDEAARLIGEQAEDWNNARLKAGTKEAGKEPKKHRNGEYLASDFAAVHQFLFTPEGRRKVGAFAAEMAKNDAVRGLIGGVIGATTGDEVDEQIRNGIIGATIAAGTPRGARALRDAFNHYGRTGSIMRKSPSVSNKDIGYWRAFVAPSTLERTTPDLFNRAREVIADLQEYRKTPNLLGDQNLVAEKIAQGEIVDMMRKEAKLAEQRGQKNLAKRISMTADEVAGKLTKGQRAVRETLRHTGVRKQASGREVEHVAQRTIHRVMLGFAVDSAAKNLFQPTMTLLHVSPRNMVRGFHAARLPEADKIFKELALELKKPVDTDSVGELLGVAKEGGTAAGPDSSALMRMTDNWNRRWTFFSALAEEGALDDVISGKGNPEAVAKAERVMRLTQGESGPMSGAPMFRGPVGGSLKPFMKFPNLMIENFIDAMTGEAKYPKTAVLTMGSIALAGAAFGLDMTDILVGGARPLGLDPLHPRRMQAPPIAKAAMRAGEYLSGDKRLMGDFFPTSTNIDEILQTDAAYLTLGRYPVKAIDTVRNIGGSDDPLGDLASLVGLTTSDRADTRDTKKEANEFAREAQQETTAQSRRTRQALEKATKRGDEDAVDELEQLLNPRQLREFRRNLSRGDLERIRRRVPLANREEFDRRFGEALAEEAADK